MKGESRESRGKLAVLGKASLNLAELASKKATRIERKLPMTLDNGRFATDATLSVSVSFVEVRDARDSSRIGLNSAECDSENALLRKVKDLTSLKRRKKEKKQNAEVSSTVFDWAGSSESTNTSTGDKCKVASSSMAELGSFPSSGTQLDPARKTGFFSWKRSRSKGRRVEPLRSGPVRRRDATGSSSSDPNPQIAAQIVSNPGNKCEKVSMGHTYSNKSTDCPRSARASDSHTDSITFAAQSPNNSNNNITRNFYPSFNLDSKDDTCRRRNWEVKELVSRDGQVKLKTNVFFASFDQRSERASGQSACTALVTVIAHRLHANQNMPTRSEFDRLIIQGSHEWKKLCRNDTYMQSFPDKHFDLETVLKANLRPLSVLRDKSFIGFFCPEKFECLKEAMSFDAIWNKISSSINNKDYDQPCIYIVSWNDHFFVLKVEADAYYIIDSLGERLFEGCNQAYMLKFDDSSLMYKTGSEETVCIGKECCKEFIKRFLAAIPLQELEEEKEKGGVSNHLHRRLQIEFHLCSSPYHSSSSTTSSSSTYSLFSSGDLM
ncbi:uncharacterized protein LOC132189522 isoform X2 [Corylus avellana]|uniref:uncharacterized protein LOC132189522 isoform X2 n=1 Tax=Corylus avellana TaxID=13451 RepID=UPI00286D55CE|nr:uncharacterized protein LOC132189522 isoform X2 [Corylus avellana]